MQKKKNLKPFSIFGKRPPKEHYEYITVIFGKKDISVFIKN